jgi:hypothetical protein
MKWISTKDKLPDLDKEALVYCAKDNIIGLAYRYKSRNGEYLGWREIGGCCYEDLTWFPTHWMYSDDIDRPPKIHIETCNKCNLDKPTRTYHHGMGWVCIICYECYLLNEESLERVEWTSRNGW